MNLEKLKIDYLHIQNQPNLNVNIDEIKKNIVVNVNRMQYSIVLSATENRKEPNWLSLKVSRFCFISAMSAL